MYRENNDIILIISIIMATIITIAVADMVTGYSRDLQAIRSGYSQDEKGHWVKPKLEAEKTSE
jgi:hypothetical protein